MSIKDLCMLPIVKESIMDDAHLYLWLTNSFIVEAHEVARAWGFRPKTLITWGKMKPNGTPSMKAGYYFRGATEHMLFAVRGKGRLIGPPCPTLHLSPRLAHSVKPAWSYEMIEQQSPGPYLELFARELRAGWDSWGDEIRSTIILGKLGEGGEDCYREE
jgi:N6-adenosine-specific RNA methylase IME4